MSSLNSVLAAAESLAKKPVAKSPTRPTEKPLTEPAKVSARIKRFRGDADSGCSGILIRGHTILATDRHRVALFPNRCGMPDGIFGGTMEPPEAKGADPLVFIRSALLKMGANNAGRTKWFFRADCLRAAVKCAKAYTAEHLKERDPEIQHPLWQDILVLFKPEPGQGAGWHLTARGYSRAISKGDATGPTFHGTETGSKEGGGLDVGLRMAVASKYLNDALMGLSSQVVTVEVDNVDPKAILKLSRHDGEVHYIVPVLL